jgi:hypothetical protein
MTRGKPAGLPSSGRRCPDFQDRAGDVSWRSLMGGRNSGNKPTISKRRCAGVRQVSGTAASPGFPGLSACAPLACPRPRRARSVSGSLKRGGRHDNGSERVGRRAPGQAGLRAPPGGRTCRLRVAPSARGRPAVLRLAELILQTGAGDDAPEDPWLIVRTLACLTPRPSAPQIGAGVLT